MSDPENVSPSPVHEGTHDAQDQEDAAAVQSAPSLDEDEIGTDPLERGVEPPEHWSTVAADRPTPRQQREGSSLDERLAAERPDPDEVEPKPVAETRMHELDESIDERAAEQAADDEPTYRAP
jgi:hypothetical protein